jgi:hypothetical protein
MGMAVQPKLKIPDVKHVKIDPVLVDTIIGLHVFFSDTKKVSAWMNTKNFNLGNIRPVTLFALGRGHKVQQFVNSALHEGELP